VQAAKQTPTTLSPDQDFLLPGPGPQPQPAPSATQQHPEAGPQGPRSPMHVKLHSVMSHSLLHLLVPLSWDKVPTSPTVDMARSMLAACGLPHKLCAFWGFLFLS